MGRLDGKRALVVGAAGRDNMGQVIARRFADEGARVAVAGRKMEELEALAAGIGGFAVACDLTSRDSVFAAVEKVVGGLGGVDIVVNATGWGLLKPFFEMTDDEFDRMYALQLRGPFQLFQAAIPRMGEGGSIIQISSATAKIMFHDHIAYMATKAGTDHMVRALADEFGERGIRLNSISPGVTETPMTAEAAQVPGLLDAFVPGYPLGRYGTTADIAAGCVWLASDECFMTGENLQVNGGLCLRRNPNRAEIEAAVLKHAAAQG